MKNTFQNFKKLDWVVIVCALSLCSMGLISIYSSSLFRENFSNFKKQIFFLCLGLALMFILSNFDWRALRDQPHFLVALYLLSVLSLAGLLFFGPYVRGTRRWYKIGPFSFDPLPFCQILIIALLAKYFSVRHVELYNIKHVLISGLYILVPFGLVFLQPDLGSALLLVVIWVGILVAAGIGLRQFTFLCLVFVMLALVGWMFLLKPYQKERAVTFMFPDRELQGAGWSQRQAKIAIGNGGLLGQGFGQGSQVQMGFLPLPQTDFIFAAWAEEFGFLGVGVMLALILILCLRIVKISYESKTNFPRLFALGFSVLVVLQVFIHVGMNLGLLPVVGLSLPFVSYGGSTMLAYFLGLGILESLKIHPEK